ncbi:MAG TPA: PEP-CTERM-box response regulator transcription factor [Rhizomicrobium sp.]|jgi:two-component system NtrC family response regulator|nr:PEP-CTERM-box response regulator transcription factor [Rhizomicrobium sp.]
MTETKAKVLILEDDEGLRTQYKWLLSQYQVFVAGDRKEALDVFEREQPTVAIADLGLPPHPDDATEGLAAVEGFLSLAPQAKIIVVTGNDNRNHAVRAVATGAYDFLKKPVDPELLKLTVDRALRLFDLEQENVRLLALAPQSFAAGIVGSSPQILEVLRHAEKISKTDIAVLILGESGTGKELLAQAIHRMGVRANKPFIPINCAAIPDALLEAELFGHEKGAFTGAIKQTIGKIESANGGTLFLDEIGDIPLPMQAKLLRFLEDQVIERVGGRQRIKINTRILCATHRNLVEMIAQGSFREDLYYRINEISLSMPPLRERAGDAIVLANFFLRKYGAEFGRAFKGFSPDALQALKVHTWRGNVRELENKVKRAAVMSDSSVVSAKDLDLAVTGVTAIPTLRDARRMAEREVIEHALLQTDGTISKAASLLGVSRPTLYDLMSEHGLAANRAKDIYAEAAKEEDNE